MDNTNGVPVAAATASVDYIENGRGDSTSCAGSEAANDVHDYGQLLGEAPAIKSAQGGSGDENPEGSGGYGANGDQGFGSRGNCKLYIYIARNYPC